MDRIKMFVFALCAIFFSVSASAATVVTVNIVPGQSVGSDMLGDSSPWIWAGYFTIEANGVEMRAMNDHWLLPAASSSTGWFTDPGMPSSWEGILYTYDDIVSGAPVLFSAETYSKAALLFSNGLLGYTPADPLWTASFNEMVWDVVDSPGFWEYSTRVYDQESSTQLIDIYNQMLPGLDPNNNYSGSMKVLSTPWNPHAELLVYEVSSMQTPIPPAVWLFGSGLLGLVAVARTRTVRK